MLKVRKILDNILKWMVVILMALSVFNVLWQVFTRFILHNPSSYTEELARYLLIWVGLLGAAYASGHKLHLAIDLFSAKMKKNNAIRLQIFIQICVLFFATSVMVIGGLRLVAITLTLNQVSAALQVKLAYVYMVLPISGILIAVYSIMDIISLFGQLFRPDETTNLSEKRTGYNGVD
ncbi:MAG TPA: TRAP transporter small permease [Candidatus Marinimicrobia bacterium]|nr:TRAP transporter small permease [Candidatus Neomarinimicrobiota bacterium]HRS51961.1 TRAP transporter small permease [Candidatus Neomarinimicrobiota bacterium]HRU91910.1 TRAP transporter small permease [Candidatus Neomarinimicrobiota bacterium]